MRRPPPGFVRLVGSALALVVVLGACAGSPETAASGTDHDDADVAFAQGMIPHHAQAVTMADQAVRRASDPRVRRLAQQIRDAQDPEIATMTGWLNDWGADVPPTDTSGAGHQGHGAEDMHGAMPGSMAGMMSAEQMSRLDAARGARFDRLWLRLMVAHHTGAVAAARTEIATGRAPAAVALARRIARSQASEIATMRQWLTG